MTETATAAGSPSTDERLEAERMIDARPDEIFVLLTTPARHPDLDASNTVRACRTQHPIHAVGDVVTMGMHGEDMGDYVVENHVVAFTTDAELAWAPASEGGERGGQVWGFRLEPGEGGVGTRVTHSYDWSGVTLERLRPYLPVVDRDGLRATLDRLAALAERS